MKKPKKQIVILGINGSARKKGNTATLLKKVLSFAEEIGAKTEILHLIDKDIKPCISCLAEGKCTYPCRIKDDMEKIFKKIKKVDCIILGSPTYWYSLSGLMKNFLDRLTAQDMLEPPILDGKVVGFVSTADLEGSEHAITQMLIPLSSMGTIVVPYSDVFSNRGNVWRSELGINPEKRLARNIVELANLVKERQGKWF
jgi:multimeric flavodoxin WrbA